MTRFGYLQSEQLKQALAIDTNDVSGLGTVAEQDASAVAITGGTATGLTNVAADTAAIGSGGLDVAGELRCDTLRIDGTATAAVVAQTHHVPVSINGVVYKLLLAT